MDLLAANRGPVLGTSAKPRGFRAIGVMCSEPARGEIGIDRERGRSGCESGGGAHGGMAGRWISRCRGRIRGSGLAGQGTPDCEEADGDCRADGRIGGGHRRWDGWQSGWGRRVAWRAGDARWNEHRRVGRERGVAGRDRTSPRWAPRDAHVEGRGVGWTRRGRATPGPVHPDPLHRHPVHPDPLHPSRVDSDPVQRWALEVAVGRGGPELAADDADGKGRTSVEDPRGLSSRDLSSRDLTSRQGLPAGPELAPGTRGT